MGCKEGRAFSTLQHQKACLHAVIPNARQGVHQYVGEGLTALAKKPVINMAINVRKIREDFLILDRKMNNRPIIYFDNACMSLKPRQVIEAMNRYYNEFPACGGRSLHSLGKRVTEEVRKARITIQKFINARKEKEIIFTKNTTESINLVANAFSLEEGDEVLTTDKEHNSNLLPWQRLKETKGIIHQIADFNDPEDLKNKITNKTKLISMVHSSNLDGTSINAKEIIKIAHDNKVAVMLDCAQSIPHKEVDVRKLDADFIAFSGHKMLGPTGTGCLYGKQELLEKLSPFIVGGDTVKDTTYSTAEFEELPERLEAGLQNYAGIIGFAEAANYLMRTGKGDIEQHELKLNRKITEELLKINGFDLIGPKDAEQRGGIISFNIKGMDPHNIAMILDQSANIMIRSGAHCVHSWFNAHQMKGSARASLYLYSTEEEANVFIEEMKKIVKFLK